MVVVDYLLEKQFWVDDEGDELFDELVVLIEVGIEEYILIEMVVVGLCCIYCGYVNVFMFLGLVGEKCMVMVVFKIFECIMFDLCLLFLVGI